MKKKLLVAVVAAVILLAVLFVPIPIGAMKDGGTRVYASLTYKVVHWKRLTEDGLYDKVCVYFGKNAYKSIDELWAEEAADRDHVCTAGGTETGETSDPLAAYKPVIYLYPEEKTEVSVQLAPNGGFTCTYPAYRNGWRVTASPDGTLTDADGQTYNYLYWEGKTYAEWDMSQGFCVKGADTAAFLEEALAKLGLTRREANEFIVFWLPLMQENPYNLIAFQTDAYTEAAPLTVTPTPDTVIRVFMTYRPLETAVEIPPQMLHAPEREGFTVVEWGGSMLPHDAEN